MNPITVILAEDHAIVRAGLLALLKLETDIKIIGHVENGRMAVVFADKLRPDVIVMDIAMPLLNGLEATRQIIKAAPSTKILILSAHNEDVYVDQAVAFGASGYLLKQTAARVLVDAIRAVHKGNAFFSPTIAKRRDEHMRKMRECGEVPSTVNIALTSREMETLQLIAEGKANKEIAAELNIGVKTVEKHRQRLMEKLDIHNTAGLTRYAIATGVIESSVQATTI